MLRPNKYCESCNTKLSPREHDLCDTCWEWLQTPPLIVPPKSVSRAGYWEHMEESENLRMAERRERHDRSENL